MKEYRPDFVLIPYPVYTDQRLESIDRVIYGIIYWFEHMKDGRCTASNETLGRVAGVSPRSIPNALMRLEQHGYIRRSYKDDSNRHRTEIASLISFKNIQIPGSPKPDTRLNETTDTRLTEQRKNKNKEKDIAADAASANVFSHQEIRALWYGGSKEDFQLLAWFFDKKGLWSKLTSRAKVEAAVRRHIRAARRIIRADWTQKESEAALRKMLGANEKMREEWTLETLEKYLTK